MLNKGETERSGFLVWHPEVHERFRERLFFFLLALKPYREAAFRERLQDLLREFGVSVEKNREGYCSYVVLGDFDHLLRVWLPAQGDVEFIKRARTQLPNLKAILQFTVQGVVSDWRFPSAPSRGFVNRLQVETIRTLQAAVDRSPCGEVIEANAAHWIDKASLPENNSGRRQRRNGRAQPIKAFVSLQPPGNADDAQRDFIEKELLQLIKGSKGIADCTFYIGVGFTWLLVKLVADDFSSLSGLVQRITEEYGGFGIATSTYAVTWWLAEGDAIGERGFATERPLTRAIEEFLPALRGAALPSDEESRLVQFVQQKVLGSGLPDSDRRPLQELLNAVLQRDEGAAATALYRPTVETERQIRRLLKEIAGRLYSGKLEKLAEFLKERNLEFKSLDTIPLGSVLIAARELVQRVLPDWLLPDHFEDAAFRELATTRNKLMHGASLNLTDEWQTLAEHLLSLYRARDEFAAAADKCLQRLSSPTK